MVVLCSEEQCVCVCVCVCGGGGGGKEGTYMYTCSYVQGQRRYSVHG